MYLKLINTFLNNSVDKKKKNKKKHRQMEIKKHLEQNNNKNATCKNLCFSLSPSITQKESYIDLKEERQKINEK